MANQYEIDGLVYTDKLPHSRVERLLSKMTDGDVNDTTPDNNDNDDQNNG